ncbi:GDSL esterase/lipase At5g03610-like [Triticum urartu]|uniref:GDSL esterase/lipase At5g03610-like n=1 Tax=Triticum urartu TaxID=4572 RepID=UPI002043DF15|nr:GDSL esterase/lipase At5g03610-like [Triticum urartu]
MNLPAIPPLACALLLLHLNVSPVESSPPQGLGKGRHPPGKGNHHGHNGHSGDDGHQHDHSDDYNGYSFYVFGDSFADNGNLVKMNPRSQLNRQWRYPYGLSGRFSNSLVQSDFIAYMLGQKKSPPAHRLTRKVGRAGLNFAAGGSGVFDVPGTQTLARQIHTFHKLVKDGDIDQDRLASKSVALVAVSGNDYAALPADTKSFAEVEDFARKVVEEIAFNVRRLQDIGVQKVLVNNLHPFGCSPSETRAFNHTRCNERRNLAATLHNHHLANELAGMEDVLVVDLNAAFSNVVRHYNDEDGGGDIIPNLFREKLAPCCESTDPKGYCGQVDTEKLEPLYKVCDNPNYFFFWDEMNPTMVGWQAVMGPLDYPIRKFLGLIR